MPLHTMEHKPTLSFPQFCAHPSREEVMSELFLIGEALKEVHDRLTDESAWQGWSEDDLIAAMKRQGILVALAHAHLTEVLAVAGLMMDAGQED